MDEKLEYNQERRSEEDVASKWQLGITSMLSCDSKTSVTDCSPQDYHLKYILEKESRSQRPVIPATRLERLSYFRSYVTSPSKTQIVCMQHVRFNRFFWYYVFNVFFKSIPHTFVYIFLSSYAPDEHFFITKMVPICHGFSISYIISAILDMVSYIVTVIALLDYAVCGLIYKNPWNRCIFDLHIEEWNITINCYDFNSFSKKVKNKSVIFNTTHYVSSEGENFQMAPLVYYNARLETLTNTTPYGSMQLLYFIIIWIVIALHHKQLLKRYLWKVSHVIHMAVNFIYLSVFIHLTFDYLLTKIGNASDAFTSYDNLQDILWKADVDMLAESMTSPPAVHILTARSVQEIQPNRDSAVLITSNAIYYIFRGLLSYRVKKYCESLIKTEIYLTDFNQDSFFYFWPIYFSTFQLGDFYTVIFFIFNFLMELFTLIITFQCLVEAIAYEWRFAKRMTVTIILSAISFVWFFVSSENEKILFYIYTKAIVTLMEVIGIYIIYPTGRLIDDITFHNGVIPTKMRTLLLRVVPLFYGIKVFTLFDALFEVTIKVEMYIFLNYFYWCLGTMLLPAVMGALYSAYVYIWKRKKTWKSLFRPDDAWGLQYSERQLRKQYDSSKFVGSQAPRKLSRYMIRKGESKVYNLDIRYDLFNRRSTLPNLNIDARVENEKKSS